MEWMTEVKFKSNYKSYNFPLVLFMLKDSFIYLIDHSVSLLTSFILMIIIIQAFHLFSFEYARLLLYHYSYELWHDSGGVKFVQKLHITRSQYGIYILFFCRINNGMDYINIDR